MTPTTTTPTTMTKAPLFNLPVDIMQLLGEEYLPIEDVKAMRSTCKILEQVYAPQLKTTPKTPTPTTTTAPLFTLPVEILQLLGNDYLPKKDVKTLRTTCKILEQVYAPQLFSKVKLSGMLTRASSGPRATTYPRHLIQHMRHLTGTSDEIVFMLFMMKALGYLHQLRILDIRIWGFHQDQQMFRIDKSHGPRRLERSLSEATISKVMKNLPTIDYLFDLIAECSELEVLYVDFVPNNLEWGSDRDASTQPFWPKLETLAISCLPFFTQPLFVNHVARHAPNVETLRFHLPGTKVDEDRFMNLKLLIEVRDFVDFFNGREYGMAKDAFANIFELCPKLKNILYMRLLADNPTGYNNYAGSYVMPADYEKIESDDVVTNHSYPHLKNITCGIFQGHKWQNFNVWKPSFPNLETFSMDGYDAPWVISTGHNANEFKWESLTKLCLLGKTGPQLVEFAAAFPNLVSLQLTLSKQNWIACSPIFTEDTCFTHLKRFRVDRMNQASLEWLSAAIRLDKGPKLESIELPKVIDDEPTAQSLLTLLQLVADDVENVYLELPTAFDPNWLLDLVWPPTKVVKDNLKISLGFPSDLDFDDHANYEENLERVQKRGTERGFNIRLSFGEF